MDKLEIKPFGEFWLNCDFNNHFSILVSYDERYRELSYINCYTYEAYNEWAPKHITIDNSSELQWKIFNEAIEKKFFSFEYCDGSVRKIIEMLQTSNLLIKVELYEWLPNSPSWHVSEKFHYALLIGYNEKKREFVAIDDDNSGYGIKYIPYTRFVKCVRDKGNIITGYAVSIHKETDYELNMINVVNYANKLLDNLQYFVENNDFWNIRRSTKGEDLCKFYAFEVFKIENRQKANILLARCLYSKKYISYDIYKNIVAGFEKARIDWQRIKNMLLKEHMRSRNTTISNLGEMNNLKTKCIMEEIKIWKIINSIGDDLYRQK